MRIIIDDYQYASVGAGAADEAHTEKWRYRPSDRLE